MYTPKAGVYFLKTRDLEETTRFYAQVMGFPLVLDQKTCRIFRICQNCHIGFCLTEGDTGSEEVIVTIEIEDVDGFCAYLETQNVEIDTLPRFNERYNIYQMFIRDPNGYCLEVQRFLDPAWEKARQP